MKTPFLASLLVLALWSVAPMPKSRAADPVASPAVKVIKFIDVAATGTITLVSKPTTLAALKPKLKAFAAQQPQPEVVIRAAAEADAALVAKINAACQAAGLDRVSSTRVKTPIAGGRK